MIHKSQTYMKPIGFSDKGEKLWIIDNRIWIIFLHKIFQETKYRNSLRKYIDLNLIHYQF